jgi:hypothetical protein
VYGVCTFLCVVHMSMCLYVSPDVLCYYRMSEKYKVIPFGNGLQCLCDFELFSWISISRLDAENIFLSPIITLTVR